MARQMTFQTAFNKGELDPALFGRADWQPYFSGARKLRNMVTRAQGGAVKRGGLKLVVEALDQTQPSILVRFQYSVEQVYLLEFSDFRFRVLMDGGVVTYPDGYTIDGANAGGREVIVTSPYSAEQMRRVRVTQNQDIMILTHPDFRPRILTRKDHHIWEFSTMLFGAEIDPPASLKLVKNGRNGVKYVVAAIADDSEESLPGDMVETGLPEGHAIPLPTDGIENLLIEQLYNYAKQWEIPWPPEWNYFTLTSVASILYVGQTMGVITSSYPEYSNGRVTYIARGIDGSKNNIDQSNVSYAYSLVTGLINKGYKGILATMREQIAQYVEEANINSVSTGLSLLEWEPVENAVRYRVYRSASTDNGEFFFHLGETMKTSFEDDNLAFASSETPQSKKEVFSGPNDYPGVCAFHEQRLYLARSNNQPNTFWGSRVGVFRNFNRNLVEGEDGEQVGKVSDTSALEFTINAKDVNEILWLEPMSDILVGTGGGEFTISGGSYIITATNVSAVRQSRYGCSSIQPLVVGQTIIGVGANGRMLRAFKWNYSSNAYAGADISHFAGHLFRRRRIASTAYQSPPDSIIWVVMSDGSLLSCTIVSEEEVLSWCRHDTDGRFEAVVNMIGLDGEDDIYFEVAREVNGKTKRFIEQLQPSLEDGDDVRDAWYLDCASEYRGKETYAISGLDYLEGKTVTCFGDGNVYPNLLVENGKVILPAAVGRAVIGLPYQAEVETMEMELFNGGFVAQNKRRAIKASVLFYHTRECLYGDPAKPSAAKFGPEDPLIPRTVRKTFTIPARSDGQMGGLWLASPSPVPFGVLSLAVRLSVGDMTAGSGKGLSA